MGHFTRFLDMETAAARWVGEDGGVKGRGGAGWGDERGRRLREAAGADGGVPARAALATAWTWSSAEGLARRGNNLQPAPLSCARLRVYLTRIRAGTHLQSARSCANHCCDSGPREGGYRYGPWRSSHGS